MVLSEQTEKGSLTAAAGRFRSGASTSETGWSWTSWTYKANEYPYHHVPEFAERHEGRDWGLFVLNAKLVNLLTATFEEIAEAYRAGRTERARKTYICEVMEERFRER